MQLPIFEGDPGWVPFCADCGGSGEQYDDAGDPVPDVPCSNCEGRGLDDSPDAYELAAQAF
jgi:DnaJ-class molecular chaperone